MSKWLISALIFTTVIIYCIGTAIAGGISWENSLEKGLQLAKQNNKPIMVDFYTDWCGWCKKLDSDTYSNTKVQALADKFICVKVNGDKDRANTAKYGVNGYPTIVFLSSEGKEIDRNVGYTIPEELTKTMQKLLGK